MEANRSLVHSGFQNFFLSVLCILALTSEYAKAQNQPPNSINKKRLNALIIGTAVGYSATMIGLNQVWYSDFDKQPFSFFNDSKEWLQLDKAGHTFSTYQLTSLSSRALEWSGMPTKKSIKIAALSSFLMVSSIEVFDGYSAGYGASATDLLANAVGSTLFLGQHLLWNEVRIRPKISFHPTDLARIRPSILGENFVQQLIKDYNGHTFWLSVDMDKFTPFPKWLNWAIGYGGHDMVYANKATGIANGYNPYRQFYLSLDLDLSQIKTKSKGVKTLLYIVNMIKLPSPTLEYSKGRIKTYAFYF